MLQNNNKETIKKSLINTLMHYVIASKRKTKRTGVTHSLNREVVDEFYHFCRKMGLLNNGRINVALEALMLMCIEEYKDEPAIVQTTLLGEKTKKPQLDIAAKLELNLVKKDLDHLIDALENKRGHPDFLESKLREVLPKAIRLYEDTRDSELETMLTKVEKFV